MFHFDIQSEHMFGNLKKVSRMKVHISLLSLRLRDRYTRQPTFMNIVIKNCLRSEFEPGHLPSWIRTYMLGYADI